MGRRSLERSDGGFFAGGDARGHARGHAGGVRRCPKEYLVGYQPNEKAFGAFPVQPGQRPGELGPRKVTPPFAAGGVEGGEAVYVDQHQTLEKIPLGRNFMVQAAHPSVRSLASSLASPRARREIAAERLWQSSRSRALSLMESSRTRKRHRRHRSLSWVRGDALSVSIWCLPCTPPPPLRLEIQQSSQICTKARVAFDLFHA